MDKLLISIAALSMACVSMLFVFDGNQECFCLSMIACALFAIVCKMEEG